MFDAINIRSDSKQSGIDKGVLAEALVFYGRVNVYGSAGTLYELIDEFTPSGFVDLHSEGVLRFHFYNSLPIVLGTDEGTARVRYDYGFVSEPKAAGNAAAAFSAGKMLRKRYKEGEARKLESVVREARLERIDLVEIRRLSWRADVLGTLLSRWVTAATDGKIQVDPAAIKCWELAGSIQVVAPLDFAELNEITARLETKPSPWTIARFLAEVLNAYADIHAAAVQTSDISTNAYSAPLITELAALTLAATQHRTKQIEELQELVFGEGNSIGAAINGGERSLGDLLPIIERRKKFRGWLAKVAPDSRLIREYYREVTRESWIETLKGKAMRWILSKAGGAGADSMLPGAGIGVEVLDALVLDKALKGWRPNQFLEGKLKGFVLPRSE